MNGSKLIKIMLKKLMQLAALSAICITLPACHAQTPEQAAKDIGLNEDSQLNSVSFSDSQHGWAVGIEGLILATNDGGAHWEKQQSTTHDALFHVQFVDNLHGWVAAEYMQILATSDGGKSWKRQDNTAEAQISDLFFVDALHGWITDDHGHITTTNDGGKNWQTSFVGTDSLGSVRFTDLQNGWAAAGSVIAYTTDGGKSWQKKNVSLPVPLWKLAVISQKSIIALGESKDIAVSEDGGAHWELKKNPNSTHISDIFFVDQMLGWGVGAEGTILGTKDGGNSWNTQNSGTDVFLNSVTFADHIHGWAVGHAATILATNDGGQTWNKQLTATPAKEPAFTQKSEEERFYGKRHDLSIVGYNYTNRYISQFTVDNGGGGDVNVSSETGGGGGISCCVVHIGGAQEKIAEVTWDTGACTFDNRLDRDGSRLFQIHHFFKTVKVQVDPNMPKNPHYMEVHFFPDGHVEAAVTEAISPPRLRLSADREDKSDYPACPNNVEPK
jgi:photosystem II stability/assembly factor-like uncharacterized protein